MADQGAPKATARAIESAPGSVFAEGFRACGLGYPRATLLNLQIQMRLSLVETGRFLSIFSDCLMRFSTKPKELKVLPVELPFARVPVGILTLRNRMLSPSAKLFIEQAREVAKPLARRRW
jgi:DNA-binding transcriptional LysR family regulator